MRPTGPMSPGDDCGGRLIAAPTWILQTLQFICRGRTLAGPAAPAPLHKCETCARRSERYVICARGSHKAALRLYGERRSNGMSELSRSRGSEGYVICDDASTRCLPKNALNPLGRKGFRFSRFHQSTVRLPIQLFTPKGARVRENRAPFRYFFRPVRGVIQL